MATDQNEWDLVAEPSRRLIIEALAERPQAVGELARALPISRPAVSQHLKALKDFGLVSETPAGTRRLYRLNPEAALALRDQLDTFWARTLEALQDTEGSVEEDQP